MFVNVGCLEPEVTDLSSGSVQIKRLLDGSGNATLAGGPFLFIGFKQNVRICQGTTVHRNIFLSNCRLGTSGKKLSPIS